MHASYFQRQLQSILHQQNALRIVGIVLGRFQRASLMDDGKIQELIDALVDLPANIPVIANVDFGHTSPMLTIPIGGRGELEVSKEKVIKFVISDE